MRAACYARYSSDLQRDTSIEDQLRVAWEFARKNGWTVQKDHNYTDAAVSGASIEGRAGIQRLLAAAVTRPRPFDVVLVDDSSRISRDIADAIRVMQVLKFHGLRVIYISQGIDSDSEQSDAMVAVHGIVDSLYLKELAKKIKRGLAGQLERGFATGAKTFGYRTVPVLDPSGKRAPDGGPALLGRSIEVDAEEANVVRRIFEMAANGKGLAAIVERLNVDGVPTARAERWSQSAVGRILRNERYLGKQIWGQRYFERKPGSAQKVPRAVPREQWKVAERPELRIVSDELWERTQSTRAAVRAAVAHKTNLARGKDARFHSPHLFSGFMRCGVCGGAITTVTGGKGSPRFGCSRSWRNGVSSCANRLTIRAKVAEPLLLKRLQEEVLKPEVKDYVVRRVADELRHAFSKGSTPKRQLEAKLRDEERKLKHLVAAVEGGGDVAVLLGAMRQREASVKKLQAELARRDRPAPKAATRLDLAKDVSEQLKDLHALLKTDTQRVKSEFRRLNLQLSLEPTEAQPRPYFSVTGQCDLLALAFFVVSRRLGAHLGRSLGRAASARNWWRARFTICLRVATDRSSR